jgi:dihydroneopterin aldolase/2-amino-4-hydroxy-6-hydroxymethyldihydropteridine diphosphokinase
MSFDISINKIQTLGCHGIYENEKSNPQKFEIDLLINFEKKISDEISETLNYEILIEETIDFVKNNSYNLIETLAYNLVYHIKSLDILSNFNTALEISVTVFKPETKLNKISDNISVRYSEKFS